MKNKNIFAFLLVAMAVLVVWNPSAEARKRRRGYSGPAPTHPVILWSRTLEESQDPEQRKVAAFKLSQYSQPIFQPKVVSTLMACAKDPDVQIKVLCTKALGGAKSASQQEQIRDVMLGLYKSDAILKNTIVRAFIARKEASPAVQSVLLDSLAKSTETEELLVLLSYFEDLNSTTSDFGEKLVQLYHDRSNIKVRRSVVKVLGAKAKGEDKVIALLAECAQERDTPLALNCLAGLQLQAKKDARAWAAVQKTILSDDPDVLLATLDVIDALPEVKNTVISTRLLELIDDIEDPDIQEKAVLALGVCGDQSEKVVEVLQKVFRNEKTEEATRIAAALTLGKQAVEFPEKPRELLSQCAKEGTSQSLKTACNLGLNELPKATTGPTPASTAEAAKTTKTN